ncbi:MAG: hemolysin family protein [Defluviitaleaceae bacterium]|nr:hemolysin family protein [Defluviitaleaceae bacterium]
MGLDSIAINSGVREIILALVLVLLSAFFSMSETSFTALNKYKIKTLAEEKNKRAQRVEKATENKDRMLSSILIGNNLSNTALGSIATTLAMSIAGNDAVYIVIATGLATLILLIFGEITPKNIALENPEKVAMLVVKPLTALMVLLSPIAAALNFVISRILRLFGFHMGEKESGITENELKTILEVGVEEGVIEQEEHKMMDNVLHFNDAQAKDVMTPRTDMAVINVAYSYLEVLQAFTAARMSRLPVFQDNIDNIVGVLHIKDFISVDNNAENFSVANCMRKPFFTLELKNTRKVFADMRRENSSLAVVLDEYGGTAGLLSMEDLIEEIVGEIFDEHDSVQVEHIAENEYIVSGAMKIDDFNELAQCNLTSEEYESVGGYVMGLIGEIPKEKDSILDERTTFVVETMEKNRIGRLRIVLDRGETAEKNEEGSE